jgi:hypothetical protein
MAVVVASRGGEPLAAALAAARWADACAVLRTRADVVLPSDVMVVDGAPGLGQVATDWVVLLGEGERLGDTQAGDLRAALARARGTEVFTVGSVTSALGLTVRLRLHTARVASPTRPVVAFTGRGLEFSRTGTRTVALGIDLVGSRGADLSETVDVAAADGAALAALVESTHGRVRGRLIQPVVAGLRALTGQSPEGRLGLGRWVLAVLEAYRVVVTQAKMWELKRDRVVVFR